MTFGWDKRKAHQKLRQTDHKDLILFYFYLRRNVSSIPKSFITFGGVLFAEKVLFAMKRLAIISMKAHIKHEQWERVRHWLREMTVHQQKELSLRFCAFRFFWLIPRTFTHCNRLWQMLCRIGSAFPSQTRLYLWLNV